MGYWLWGIHGITPSRCISSIAFNSWRCILFRTRTTRLLLKMSLTLERIVLLPALYLDFLSKDIVDAASDAEECDNSSSEAIQQQSVGKAKEAGGRPKKLGSRKPTKDKADSIFVGPPPHMASQTVGLRMTEDGWVEVDLGDLPVDLQLGDLPVDHPLKLKRIQPDAKG